ncbi:MAG: hypothetical protein HY898_08120 [Deltaproteobacteria bacterium]|nr:hypothetical protein [Deltaproteobacteria bacterium]
MLGVNLDRNPGLTADSLKVGDRRQGTARVVAAIVAFASLGHACSGSPQAVGNPQAGAGIVPMGSTSSSSAAEAPDKAAAGPAAKVSVLANEVRLKAADGSVQEGGIVEPGPYEAVLHMAISEIGRCTQGGGEPSLIATVQPSGAVSAIEVVKDAPPCLGPLVQRLVFPARRYEVSLLIVVTPVAAPAGRPTSP